MKKYYPELDGLRGLAALMVFFSHAIGLLSPSAVIIYLQQSPFRALWDGAAAVDFFFVLSGFVLALPFVSGRSKLNYFRFAIRRSFRLYPAYWLALFSSIILHSMYRPLGMYGLSDWAQTLWRDPIDLGLIVSHATLLLKTNTHAIDPVVWSLIIEMKMSLLLPIFIYFLIQSNRAWQQIALVAASFILAMITDKLMFFPHFALGASLASNWPYFSNIVPKISGLALFGLLIIIYCLYGNRWVIQLDIDSRIQSYFSAFSGLLLVLVATGVDKASALLKSNVCTFLGKTSYSFYLFHLPILLVVTASVYPFARSVALCSLLSLMLSYALAYCCHCWIELPAIRIGKALSNRCT